MTMDEEKKCGEIIRTHTEAAEAVRAASRIPGLGIVADAAAFAGIAAQFGQLFGTGALKGEAGRIVAECFRGYFRRTPLRAVAMLLPITGITVAVSVVSGVGWLAAKCAGQA